MSECLRCGKKNVEIHSCSPTKTYRAAMVEGIKLSLETIANYKITSEYITIPEYRTKWAIHAEVKKLREKYQETK